MLNLRVPKIGFACARCLGITYHMGISNSDVCGYFNGYHTDIVRINWMYGGCTADERRDDVRISYGYRRDERRDIVGIS